MKNSISLLKNQYFSWKIIKHYYVLEKCFISFSITMNPTLKKIFMYFAIAWALVIAVLWIIAIWWNINEDIIGRTLLTYLILFLAFVGVSTAPKLYEMFKHYPDLSSVWSRILVVSVFAVAILICMDIWHSILSSDLIWKIIATIGVVNFSVLVFVFSINKWWGKSSE